MTPTFYLYLLRPATCLDVYRLWYKMNRKDRERAATTSSLFAASHAARGLNVMYFMGSIRLPKPVLLFMAVFSSDMSAFDWVRERAEKQWGPLALESGAFSFETFTDYYAATMGTPLPKRLWAFENLIMPDVLPKIKCLTNDWESEFKPLTACTAERPLNIDPGYIDLGKLILASTKDHAHRIYLSEGIFAETTLMYTQKQWKPLLWTYPDYQSAGYQEFLTRCREYLKSKRTIPME